MKVMNLSSEKEKKNNQTICRQFLNVLEVFIVLIYFFKVLRILKKLKTTDLYFYFSLNNEMGVIKN